MTCDICSQDIGARQLRHSDGTGNYHMICEFNLERARLRLPLFETLKRVKYYGLSVEPVSRGRVHLNLQGGRRKAPARKTKKNLTIM